MAQAKRPTRKTPARTSSRAGAVAPKAKTARTAKSEAAISAAGAAAPRVTEEATGSGLRTWHFVLTALYALQGIAILILSTTTSYQVTTGYRAVDPLQSAAQGKPVPAFAAHTLFDIQLNYLIGALLLLAALAHLLYATWYRRRYESNLVAGRNPARWVKDGILAGLAMVAIAVLAGMQDLSLLLSVFVLPILANLCWLAVDLRGAQAGKPAWLTFTSGVVAGALPWIFVAIYLVSAPVFHGNVPGFVWWLFATILVLSIGFLLLAVSRLRGKGRWAGMLPNERAYLVLSFVTSTALAWQIFAGALRP